MMARYLHDLRDEKNNIRRNRIFRDRNSPLEKYNDLDFYKKYRFDRASIIELTSMLENDLLYPDERNNPYPPIIQVMATLRYYASNSFQDVVSETLVGSQPSVSRIVRRVSTALAKRAQEFIIYPTSEVQLRKFRSQFSESAGMPQVIGCIDGTHVPVIVPSEYAQSYRCRKGFTSINVQAVCGPNGEFIDLVAKWPGSAHDSRIFRESSLGQKLDRGERPGILLGDRAYGCRSFLLTPYRNPVTRSQKRFNFAHSSTRSLIERVFGMWKRRFSILHSKIRMKLENVFHLIVACGFLHNIAVKKGLPDLDDDDYEEESSDSENEEDEQIRRNLDRFVDGKSLRDHITAQFF